MSGNLTEGEKQGIGVRKYKNQSKSDLLWLEMDEEFRANIISSSGVDFFTDGFSVRILFNSTKSFRDRKMFFLRRKADIFEWLRRDLMLKHRVRTRIGDVSFYIPVEITLMRIPEIDIKFERRGQLKSNNLLVGGAEVC